MAEKIRVQKLLAQRGVCSRRKAEEMIQAGRVQVNGRPVKLGDGAVPGKDIITVDGQRLPREGEGRVYLALHKPRGFVTTMADERGTACGGRRLPGVPGGQAGQGLGRPSAADQ